MNLIIKNRVIDTPINVILNKLKEETNNGLLSQILPEKDNNIAITCPMHKNGRESNPSCQVFTKKDDPKIEYGQVHCFTCGFATPLAGLVGFCFGRDIEFGSEWLYERFGVPYTENFLELEEIDLSPVKQKTYLPQNVLEKYNYYHDYLFNRGITKDVIDKFNVGYDQLNKMVTFPVWDTNNNLVMITSRSVIDKTFYIDKDKDKPVYLLNFINNENITSVYVCESQINALTLWSWGYPAIALIGTGSAYQYNILNKCGIRNYILCFDGDEAGDKGRDRFYKNIRKDVFVSYKQIPRGKDVNDLTKEEFNNIEELF